MSNQGEDELQFDIDASIIFQLGDQLITDDIQALVELIKNSYDADSSYANVRIDTTSGPGEGFTYSNAKGCIIIEDDGTGMDLGTIKDGWLFISKSPKREFKAQHRKTKKGRTPLGDKGLGRLGVQKLGENVEIITRTAEGQSALHVSFSWEDFRQVDRLSDVRPKLKEVQTRKTPGTTLVISAIKDVDAWKGEDATRRLQTELSRMLSPYAQARDFTVAATLDGKRIELAEITDLVRSVAQVRYLVDFDGGCLQIKGMSRLDFFRVHRGDEKEIFEDLVSADNGQAFLDFLLKLPASAGLNLRRSSRPGWFVEFERARGLEDIDGLVYIDEKPADPGPFHAEVDSFNFRQLDRFEGVFNKESEFKNYIKSFSGIRVYRDGFGVRVPDDWLELRKGWTSGGSYYGLRPENTLGFVQISARENAQLLETTNREAFTETPYYLNFKAILQEFIRFSSEAQEFVRRGWNEFKKVTVRTGDGQPRRYTTTQLAGELKVGFQRAAETRERAEHFNRVIETAVARVVEITRALPADAAESVVIRQATKELNEHIKEAGRVRVELEASLREIDRLENTAQHLVDRMETLSEQLAEVYETVSLGLTAEVLSHEIQQVADGLAARTKRIKDHLGRQKQRDATIQLYAEHVSSSVAALRKQLGHLTPSLRYARHKREQIDVQEFAQSLLEFHEDRLIAATLKTELIASKQSNFIIFMNRGKLTQVVDNLILNSEYWLREELRTGRSKAGCIFVEVSKPYIRIWDNGRGIDPAVEDTLFQPFVTTKKKDKGRGLGLFIVRQLLDSDGCTITILPTRNEQDRLFKFQIDFSGSQV
ncbi:sensor histidine kinase [Tautonia sp. JC769]|uniref:sensor histidine kinase n=1 Tax=Tautonia sp. JC769 TaxID=3232135 RepID=UPI003459FE4F